MPVLWDKKTKQIVNNESADIVRMFNSAFNEHAKNPDLDLYPEELVKEIDAVNDWVRASVRLGTIDTVIAYQYSLSLCLCGQR